jgi:hypothetical protein
MENNKIKKFSVKLNNNEKIEQLLQETYDQCCRQHNSIQDEMNKLSSSTVFKDLDIDGKEKYSKAMANYFKLQQNAITQKYDIAHLMAEVVKHGGNVKDATDAMKNQPTTLDLNKLRKLAEDAASKNAERQEYISKK